MQKDIYKEVIDNILSKELRKELLFKREEMQNQELIALIEELVPNVTDRQAYYNLIANGDYSPIAIENAKKYLEYYNYLILWFRKESKDFYYEVEIKFLNTRFETPQRYIAESYFDIMRIIKAYQEAYDDLVEENEETIYKITKQRKMIPTDDDSLSLLTSASVLTIGYQGSIKSVICDQELIDCDKKSHAIIKAVDECRDSYRLVFPKLIPKYSLVCFFKEDNSNLYEDSHNDEEIQYGILLDDYNNENRALRHYVRIMLLSNDIKKLNELKDMKVSTLTSYYYRTIKYYKLDCISIDELPKEHLGRYACYMAWIDFQNKLVS